LRDTDDHVRQVNNGQPKPPDVFISGRGGGKTTYILGEFLKDPHGYLVVANQGMKRHIHNQIHPDKRTESRIITAKQFRDGSYLRGRGEATIYIDDLEECFREVSNPHSARSHIEAYSVTGNHVNPSKPKPIYTKPTDVEKLQTKVEDFSLLDQDS